jgi:hypothetical protein
MRCSNGHENPDGQGFCGTCGEMLTDPEGRAAAEVARSSGNAVVPDHGERDIPVAGESVTPTERAGTAPDSSPRSSRPIDFRNRWVLAALGALAILVVVIVVIVSSGGGGGSSDSANANLVSDVASNCNYSEALVLTLTQQTQDAIKTDVSKNYILRQVRNASNADPSAASDPTGLSCKIFFDALVVGNNKK